MVPGVEERHSGGCPHRTTGECACVPRYRAYVFDDDRGEKRWGPTFPTAAEALRWRTAELRRPAPAPRRVRSEAEQQKERDRRARAETLDALDETGELTCDVMPWLSTARVSYEEFVRRVVRYASRREAAVIHGVVEAAKLRRAIRVEAKRVGVSVKTWDFGRDLVKADPSLARVVEWSERTRGHDVGLRCDVGFQHPWHELVVGPDVSEESLCAWWGASLVEKVEIARRLRGEPLVVAVPAGGKS